MRKSNQPKTGFTMVELLVTVALMAALSAGVLATIGPGSRRTARDAQRRADINSIASALEMYRNDNGRYPGASEYGTELVTEYLAALPADPVSGSYTYTPAPTGCTVAGTRCTTFSLCGNLERTAGTYCVNNP